MKFARGLWHFGHHPACSSPALLLPLLFLLVVVLVDRGECFQPNDVAVDMEGSPDSRHHADITMEALSRVTDRFLRENLDLYPEKSHDRLKNSISHKGAMNLFRSIVGKPHSFSPYSEDASYHFTAEKLKEANQRIALEREKVVTAIKLQTYDVARTSASLLLHIVQDFYSSTNWIEMGNQMIKDGLGTTSAFEESVFAAKDERTCTDCQPLGECYGNIKREILVDQKLTSAYYSKHKVPKPAGKCGYGGNSDTFREKDAKGGINKDTKNPERSPHHYLHNQAASMAVDGTVDALESIYQATIDDRERFGAFLGIELLTSLCFVVDTTGSMSGEIEDVKALTINMTEDAAGLGMDYVLVPVNDPHPGIIHMTNDSAEMIRHLKELRADGGGDTPEMSISGMLLAAQNVRTGSQCYVFTDAEAKDKELKETLKSVIALRKVKMEFKLTDAFSKKRRRKRSTSVLENDYRDIAEVSGGSLTLVKKGQLKEVLKIVEIESKMSSVFVSYGYSSSAPIFEFPVDSTMNETFVEVTIIGSVIHDVTFTSPKGSVEIPAKLTNLPNNKVLKLANVETGQWKAEVKLEGPAGGQRYSYRVFCESGIDFTYTLISETGASVESSPIRGKRYYVSLAAYGPVDLDSLSLLFLSVDGSTVSKVKVVRSGTNLNAKMDLPTEDTGFFVALQGLDKNGLMFQRVNPNIIKTSWVTLDLSLSPNDTLDMTPGSTVKVKVELSNRGVRYDLWKVNVFDSAKFLVGQQTFSLPVQTNMSSIFELTFTSPNTATPGQVSTVSLSTRAEADAQVKNSLTFYVSIVPKDSDLTSPTCTVLNVTKDACRKKSGHLECNSTRWTALVSAQDLESGLKLLKASPVHPLASFSSQAFDAGTKGHVTGSYEGTCCHRNVTVVAVDGNGNVGRCTFRLSSAVALVDFRGIPVVVPLLAAVSVFILPRL